MSDPLRVLIHNNDTAGIAAKLRAAFPAVSVAECTSCDALPARLREFCPHFDYTVRCAGTPNYPRDALFGADGPRWVANGGAGTDHFGMWDTSRTIAPNAAGVAADMMARYVFGSFLHFTPGIAGFPADKAQKIWQTCTVRPLKGQTLIIAGLGHTGQAIAKRARAFGVAVTGTRAHPRPLKHADAIYASDEWATLLPNAGFIAVAVPLTPATRSFPGQDAFAAMKPGVILADVSRGGVVNQCALPDALENGVVAGAAPEVFETEPLPADGPVWASKNSLISPHCSSATDGWAEASFKLFQTNLTGWAEGAELLNIVDPVRGTQPPRNIWLALAVAGP